MGIEVPQNHFQMTECPHCGDSIIEERHEHFPHGGRRAGELYVVKTFGCGTEIQVWKLGSDTNYVSQTIGVVCFEKSRSHLPREVKRLREMLEKQQQNSAGFVEEAVRQRLQETERTWKIEKTTYERETKALQARLDFSERMTHYLIRQLDDAQRIPPVSEMSEWEWEEMDENTRLQQWMADVRQNLQKR
jgi:hypothetical protein